MTKPLLFKLSTLLLAMVMAVGSYAEDAPLSKKKKIEWLEIAQKEYRDSNYVNAIDAAKIAAEAGYAPAQHFYAFLLWGGSFTEAAFDWYGKSGVQGNLDSYYEMAQLILNGDVERGGIQQAIALLTESANKGHSKSLELLFRINRNGRSDWPANNNNALRWLTKALQEQQAWAMFTWASILETGEMNQVPSQEQSIHWLVQAGEKGHRAAVKKLILVYENGLLGQVSNKSKVKYWNQIFEDL